MWPFNRKKKLDPYLKSLSKLTTRTKLPVLISYKGDTKTVKNKIKYTGAGITHEYVLTQTLAASIPLSSIEKISSMPEVRSLYYDHKASLCIHRATKSLSIDLSKGFNLTGRDVTIGIVDSGIFPHKGLTLKPNTIKYFKDIINGDSKPYDDNGHGTYLSGIIASNFDYALGIAPDCSLSVAKAFDKTGYGSLSNILKAVEDIYASTPEVKIFLLPFEIKDMPDLRANPLRETIELLHSKNIVFIAPSGNSGPNPYSIHEPASYKEVITVGGCTIKDDNFRITDYSSRGPLKVDYLKPDVLSLSEGIISLRSDIFYTPGGKLIDKETIGTTSLSGTSVSSAIIAGVCALLIEKYGDLTPKDIRSILYLGSKSIGENRNTQGRGIVMFSNLIKDKK
ncbi:S8 family peptidase [Clostridium cylindrosporum]|uniref:Serine protease AprX n=1 Tax=Clostridium cylindrosporum DSM 605 TaxID=1121307 RepID=A0A0J8DC38_CLOCY|nr:S8 family serine peptidase [Clostridium cylindrosporum]KMT21869.1 serine protease AprX [Clostridium cylindrosporum DSM 605]